MGILNLFKAPVLTDRQRADVQQHVKAPYEGGSRVRPDWAGQPLAPEPQYAEVNGITVDLASPEYAAWYHQHFG